MLSLLSRNLFELLPVNRESSVHLMFTFKSLTTYHFDRLYFAQYNDNIILQQYQEGELPFQTSILSVFTTSNLQEEGWILMLSSLWLCLSFFRNSAIISLIRIPYVSYPIATDPFVVVR